MASIKSYFTALCEKYKDNIAFTVSEKGGDKNISFSELYDSVSALSSALSGYAGKRIIVTGISARVTKREEKPPPRK